MYIVIEDSSSLHFPITRKDRWGTIDDFLTSSLHVSLFSIALWESANSIPVHSLMLSSHLFFCLPLHLPPLTVPCKIVFARPDDRDTRPLQFMLLNCCKKVVIWSDGLFDLAADSFVSNTSLYDMHKIFRKHLISMTCIHRRLQNHIKYGPIGVVNYNWNSITITAFCCNQLQLQL